MDAAREALEKREFQWAAELATISIRVDPNDMEARRIKSAAFVELAKRALNPNWSDWFYTAANELLQASVASANAETDSRA